MKTPFLSRCATFLAAIVFAMPAHAQYGGSSGGYGGYSTTYSTGPLSTLYASGYIRIQVPIERAGHNFTIKYRTASGATPVSLSAYGVGFITNGPVSGANENSPVLQALQSFLVISYPPSPTYSYNYANGSYTYTYFSAYEWWLCDTTAGQETPPISGTPGGYTGTTLSYSGVLTNWVQTSGVPSRYFAIHDSRLGHSLILWNGAAVGSAGTPVSQGSSTMSTYSNGTSGATVPLHWLVGSAPGPINSSAVFLGDLNTAERTAAGATDVHLASHWVPDTQYLWYPMLETHVTLHSREAGHRFAVHWKATNAPVMSQIYTAVSAGANARLDFPIGQGLRFWVTREAEMGYLPQPVAPAGASATSGGWVSNTNNTTFSAVSPNPFPAPPLRPVALVPRLVRVNAVAHAGHAISVRQGDGYSTTYNAGPASHLDAATNAQIPPYTSGSIARWDDQGISQPLPVYTFTAYVDPRFTIKLRDETTLEEFSAFAPTGAMDWLDPWAATHPNAPGGPTITLELPFTRAFHEFARTGVSPDPLVSPTGGIPEPVALPPVTGDNPPIGPWSIAMYSLTLRNPLPYDTGSFTLLDLDTGDTTAVQPGINDKKNWFTAAQQEDLQISSSRWDHILRLCHPDGRSYPVQRNRIAGSLSAAVDENEGVETIYQQSYYYFEAHSAALAEMPWYLEDVSTGEVLAPTGGAHSPTRDEQIMWIYVEPPSGLIAARNATAGIDLAWSPNGNSSDGGFIVQRRESSGGQWRQVAMLPGDGSGGNMLTYYDTAVIPGKLYRYRVRAFFGFSVSAPTPEVQCISAWGNDSVLAEDSDHDGVSNGAELIASTDPYNPDSDSDGFWDGADHAPLDASVQLPPHNANDTAALTLTISKP